MIIIVNVLLTNCKLICFFVIYYLETICFLLENMSFLYRKQTNTHVKVISNDSIFHLVGC